MSTENMKHQYDIIAATCSECQSIINRHYFDFFGCHVCEEFETTNKEIANKSDVVDN
ncbi:hypothetical protein H0A36_28540 [Endozoicomonas sp. SM1973]|uniref:Uncharacterized protein n=1 Tax=Spartinivicinus marinus TaxID=2994442 RepID=A0A853IPY2_9GAMM|nr:hypothetical protein [Spartinivicinus marinus]MCX4027853.1 hypothetical protein [Spartinivicinus marinus]NYZ69966.1 hypothetical protein [Spartinivicinus marinus]